MRTFFLLRTLHVTQDCCESSQNPSIVGHVVVEHSFDTISSHFLFTCDLTDNTHCHTYGINWKQTTALRYFAGEGTLWPSGQLLSEHRLRAQVG